MAGLTGKTIAATYHSILKVSTSDNQNLDTTLRDVVDGEDTASSLKLATDKATFTLGTDDGDDFKITNGSSTILMVEGDNAKVGINEVSPDTALHVTHPDGTDNIYVATFENADTGEPYGILIDLSGRDSTETADDHFITCTDSNSTNWVVSGGGIMKTLPTYSYDVGATTRDLLVDSDGYIGYQSSSRQYKTNICLLYTSPSPRD